MQIFAWEVNLIKLNKTLFGMAEQHAYKKVVNTKD